MKNITLNKFKTQFRTYTADADQSTMLAFLMLCPLICFFFLLEWDFKILIFLLLAYGAALTGFIFAKSRYGQKLLIENEDTFTEMIAGMTDDLLLIYRQKDQTIVYVTDSVTNHLGYKDETLLNRPATFIVHPEDRKKLSKLTEPASLNSKLELKTMIRVLEKGKAYRWMELRAKPVVNDTDEIEYALLNFRDVHEQKELEKVSRIFAEELMKKDPALNIESQVSDQLVSLMTSHELKEPLRTIISYIQFFDHRYKDDLDQEGKDCIHFINDAATRMQDMIGDIADFFKMDGSQLVFKRVDTQKMVANVIKMLGKKIEEQNASIIVGMLPTVLADPRQLQHLFQNLIDNALKYSTEKPEIRISCKKKTSHWEFEVRDNGIGVSKAYQFEIFEAFRRLHSVNQFGGTGVGLTICKKVIDNHNGQLWLKSDGEGKGSRFFFSIPFVF